MNVTGPGEELGILRFLSCRTKEETWHAVLDVSTLRKVTDRRRAALTVLCRRGLQGALHHRQENENTTYEGGKVRPEP